MRLYPVNLRILFLPWMLYSAPTLQPPICLRGDFPQSLDWPGDVKTGSLYVKAFLAMRRLIKYPNFNKHCCKLKVMS